MFVQKMHAMKDFMLIILKHFTTELARFVI